jgi:hypothetical protein
MKEKEAPERFSLSRWSRRKIEAKSESAASIAAPASTPVRVPAAPASAAPSSSLAPAPDLPSVDSLTFDSDFTAFLRPEVDETLKRAALKRLLRDPRFNVMDGLDVYIDDYTKVDPDLQNPRAPSLPRTRLNRFLRPRLQIPLPPRNQSRLNCLKARRIHRPLPVPLCDDQRQEALPL